MCEFTQLDGHRRQPLLYGFDVEIDGFAENSVLSSFDALGSLLIKYCTQRKAEYWSSILLDDSLSSKSEPHTQDDIYHNTL